MLALADKLLVTFVRPQSPRHLARDFLQEPVAGSKTLAEGLHEALEAFIALDARRLLRAVWQRRCEGQPKLDEYRDQILFLPEFT